MASQIASSARSHGICRDCGEGVQPGLTRCAACGSPRLLRHPEVHDLAIAHLDCDAFYASVEKRDDPSLADRPVIVGGGRRGVVAAACYISRLYGVHSAMPMYKALKACPDAVVIPPDMKKYRAVGREVRTLMQEVTPLVEPLSVDEAFMDLSGTERLHGGSPAQTLTRLIRRIESELDLTASIGLSYNKFLAKVASDLDKPRGFAIVGRAEAPGFLAAQPVGLIWGVGKALRRKLVADGIATIGDLLSSDEEALVARYGAIGRRLSRFAHGEDNRRVVPNAPAKSVSAETTFERNIADLDALQTILWRLSETVSDRLKQSGIAGEGVTLKLKTADFRLRTRGQKLPAPTQLAEVLYRAAVQLLERETDGTKFRLIGVGTGPLVDGADADPPDLLEPEAAQRAKVERAMDEVRARLGKAAIKKGRALGGERKGSPSR